MYQLEVVSDKFMLTFYWGLVLHSMFFLASFTQICGMCKPGCVQLGAWLGVATNALLFVFVMVVTKFSYERGAKICTGAFKAKIAFNAVHLKKFPQPFLDEEFYWSESG